MNRLTRPNRPGKTDELVVVKGGGDIATGIAHTLHTQGLQVIVTELAQPTMVRRAVSFGQAVYEGKVTVDGVTAQLATNHAEIDNLLVQAMVPVLVDPTGQLTQQLEPYFLIDSILAKRNTGTTIDQAPIVIGVGPGFEAGKDVHAVVESNRGPNLGQIYLQGTAQANTGIPGQVLEYTVQRVLRAPTAGKFEHTKEIGQQVKAGEVIGEIITSDNQILSVTAEIPGVLRGILHNGLNVTPGFKLGDIDPRGKPDICWEISDKALEIGEAVWGYLVVACKIE